LVRTFESPVVLAIRARREAREADNTDDSLLRWGKPPVWGNSDTASEDEKKGFEIIDPRPDPPPDPDAVPRIYTEVTRETQTVRVRNPTNSSHYVDVARIKTITFRGPDGRDVRFDLNPPGGEIISG
jgi:hypothetical protein